MQISNEISAVVTGGASGLGEATARTLSVLGARVAIFDMNEERGERVAGEIGGFYCPTNVTSDESVAASFELARAKNGQERILVNCAGIGGQAKTASRDKETGAPKHFPLSVFEKVIAVNLVGSFRCGANAAKGMLSLEPLEDGMRGIIINTASVAAQDGQIGQAAYSASKGGIVGMTLPMARDLSGDGIRVNTIMPGIFETPLMAGMPENVKAALSASVPFPKRMGVPSEFASLVVEMVRNNYFNGECVRLDGAIRMPPR